MKIKPINFFLIWSIKLVLTKWPVSLVSGNRENVKAEQKPLKQLTIKTIIKDLTFDQLLEKRQLLTVLRITAWISLRPAILSKSIFCHRYFTVNFARFLRTRILKNTSGGCFWGLLSIAKVLGWQRVTCLAKQYRKLEIFGCKELGIPQKKLKNIRTLQKDCNPKMTKGLWHVETEYSEKILIICHSLHCHLTLFRLGIFGAAHGLAVGGANRPPLPKICHTCPSMMKLSAVIPYLKKTQKIHESRDTPRDFCWYQHFFTGNQQILLYQKIQI